MNLRLKQLLWLGGILVFLALLWWGITTFRNPRSAALLEPASETPKLEELTSIFDLPLFQSLVPQGFSVTSTPPLGRGNPFTPVLP